MRFYVTYIIVLLVDNVSRVEKQDCDPFES